ncbi:MAG: response regulator [Holophagales bacterium]|jgi:two-component system chemotaxis response regulator CheY|nr:response regulator [Holophagales bacterium]
MIELQNLYICLVEPSSVQANIIANELGEIGITQIGRVASGAEAIQTLEGNTAPDVVMSALYLPDMTGTDLIFAIRQQSSHSTTPFVLISSETDPRNLEGVRQAGTIAILPKPFSKVQLLRSLQNTLDFLNAEEEREEFADLKLSDLKVLIVDDSKLARRHVKTVLERIGFENFIEVPDGREAISLLGNTLVDLVVTDYNMPDVDGLALVDFIRTRSIQSSVPILMVSSMHDEGRLAAVMDAGVSAICDKPFETNLVRKLVRQFVGGN